MKEADIVVVAKLQSASPLVASHSQVETDQVPVQDYLGVFKVDRIYKGVCPPSGDLTVQYRGTANSWDVDYSAARPIDLALYFLKIGPDHRLHFYSLTIPSFPVLATRPPVADGTPVLKAIQAELLQDISKGPVPVAENAYRVLWTSPEGTRLSQQIARDVSRPLRLRAWAIDFLMLQHNPETLEFAVQFIEDTSQHDKRRFAALQPAVSSLDFQTGLSNSPNFQTGLSNSQVRRLLALKNPMVTHTLSFNFMESGSKKYAWAAIEILKSNPDRYSLSNAYTYLSALVPVPRANAS